MLRIANWYESRLGRNDGNPLYVTSCLKRVKYFCDVKLKRNLDKSLLGHFPNGKIEDQNAKDLADWILDTIDEEGIDVQHVIPMGDLKPYGDFDLHIWVDWGEDALKGVLPYDPIFPPGLPLLYWASDTHLGYDYRLGRARESSLVFCAQKDAVEKFKQENVDAHWLPHAFEPLAYPKSTYASKKYDVCFVGHVNSTNRIEALDRLFKEFPNFYFGQRLFDKAAEVMGQSKVVFNISIKDDLNMRVFETLGTGSFLLTNDIPTIHDHFKDGVHLVTYKDLDDMVAKCRYYLKNDRERVEIANAGYEYVSMHHTISERVKKMLQSAKPLLREKVHV